jgi:dimethylaniline monooxygenase (N-oxide forming)
VASDALLLRIMEGEPAVCPGIERIGGSEVVFADGRSLQVDTIIFCTGYRLDFPFLPQEMRPWVDKNSGLYRLVFPPSHPNLGFIGVCRAHGPILPIVEMQARWAARVLAGDVGLPGEGEMRAEIRQRWGRQSARQDSPIRVTPLPYLDELAQVIGVQPRLWRHPRLLRALLAGPPVAAQYRLDGPDRWDGAGDTIAAAMRYQPSGGTEPR